MVAPDPSRINGVRGWLLWLCGVLVVYQPVTMAIEASTALVALPVRGVPLGLVLVARLAVTALGIAAGLSILGRRPSAVALAKSALVLAAAMDLFVYSTPYMPSNRYPGTTPWYAGASLLFYGAWLAYLYRSKRVRATFDGEISGF
jgi:hypothetical protein